MRLFHHKLFKYYCIINFLNTYQFTFTSLITKELIMFQNCGAHEKAQNRALRSLKQGPWSEKSLNSDKQESTAGEVQQM